MCAARDPARCGKAGVIEMSKTKPDNRSETGMTDFDVNLAMAQGRPMTPDERWRMLCELLCVELANALAPEHAQTAMDCAVRAATHVDNFQAALTRQAAAKAAGETAQRETKH